MISLHFIVTFRLETLYKTEMLINGHWSYILLFLLLRDYFVAHT